MSPDAWSPASENGVGQNVAAAYSLGYLGAVLGIGD